MEGGESVDKPDSVPTGVGGDHPSATGVATGLVRPTRELGRVTLDVRVGDTDATVLALLRVGFAEPVGSPRPLVGSYPTVSPLPIRRPAVCSLWHCPAGHPGWALPTTLPCGVRTFLDPPGPRPPNRLAVLRIAGSVGWQPGARAHLVGWG